ncbi:MAG: glycosyltransferase family protein [Patescibacteria group bacterium]|nr:glycosyltransferase family protein [Patescibacteria group bacterium]MDD5294880.1 glycosyltransferase family protein [Patescibacteria group bacterium]MDD5554640.1 glycosyltransferase family protein [Patescibacteria group bacterium]
MITAIIQARMNSTRLPGKILKKIKGKPILELLVERLRHCQKIDKIIIATTKNPADAATVALAKKINCPYFIGDEDDVLDRIYQAAKKYKADIIARVTADCPLHDPKIVDDLIDFYLKNKNKYDYVSNVNPPTFPDGLDLWIFPFKTLERAWKEAKLKSEREHVCPYIWKNPHLFRVGHFESKTDYSHLRWTVDDNTDFEFIKKIFAGLYRKGKIFSMGDILNFLDQNPALHKVQEGKARDEGYAKSLEADKL